MKRYILEEDGQVTPAFHFTQGAPVWPIWTCVILVWIAIAIIGWHFI